jgi:hypothetical protein
MFKTLVEKKSKYQIGPLDTIKKVLKCKYLKCPHIVHLNLKCMNYVKKKAKNQIENLNLDHKSH